VSGLDSQSDTVSADTVFTNIDTTLNIQTTYEGTLTIYKIQKYSTVVVKIPSISSYLYMQRPRKSLEQIGRDSNYALVVNASYFDALFDDSVTYTGLHFEHAGYLKIQDTVYEQMKVDRQITRLFSYSSKRNIINYFDVSELDKTKDYDLVVQTGPQIIRKNEIDTACIDASINGNQVWWRTAFASVNGKEFYVVVTSLDKKTHFPGMTLKDLGAMLRSTGIFKKELNVINFDGGMSTSLYIRNHPEFCFYPDVEMPVVLCVK
jgi:exopolysaccharide biosynthesis protein